MKEVLIKIRISLLILMMQLFLCIGLSLPTDALANKSLDALPGKGRISGVISESATTISAHDLLQFRSGVVVLGFKPEKVYLAGMGFLLVEEFIGTTGVKPVGGNQREQKDNLTKEVPEFVKVSYPDLWPGITLHYEARPGGIAESTYIIETKGDPALIRIKYNAKAEIQKNGSLRFKHPKEKGYFTLTAPIAWQEIKGKKVSVEVAFNKYKDGSVGFKTGRFDPNQPLIIDPTYQWHAFYGQSGDDVGYAITTDSSGNVYIAGVSNAT
jgi:hypothetical protein